MQNDLSKEQQLLLQTIRLDQSAGQQIKELLRDPVDWSSFNNIAIKHGVMPLIYQRLKDFNPDLPPSELYFLKELFLSNYCNNIRRFRGLLRIADILAEHGISVIPFKGSILELQAYGDLGLRQFFDTDILIHRKQFRAVYELMVKAGYSPLYTVEPQHESRVLQKNKHLPFGDRLHQWEIHWAFTQRGLAFPLDPESCWERIETVTYLSRRINVLSIEDTLLVLSIHGTRHFWCQLKWIADVAYLLHSHPQLNWERILARAKAIGILKSLLIAVYLAVDIVGLPLPIEVAERIQCNGSIERLAATVRARLFKDSIDPWAQSVFLIQSRERIRDRLPLFFFQVFSLSRQDWTISLPWFFLPLNYLIRAHRRIVKFGSLFLRWLFRRRIAK